MAAASYYTEIENVMERGSGVSWRMVSRTGPVAVEWVFGRVSGT